MTFGRAPEPKPLTILLLGLAGALGMLSDGAARAWLANAPYDAGRAWAAGCVGIGVGFAIGAALCLTRRLVLRYLCALMFGFAGVLAGAHLFEASIASGPSDWMIVLAASWGPLTAASFVVVHDLVLRWGYRFAIPAVVFYVGLGVLSGAIFSAAVRSGRFPASMAGNSVGLGFGFLQCLGLAAALWIDLRIGRLRWAVERT
jgi:hypothetical protein